jgi:molybdenum cofactor cytidylyltransferase
VIHALLPAAGKSARMGRSKLALPLGTSTVLERLVRTLRGSGIHSVFVVVAPDDDRLAQLASRAGAAVLRLPEPTGNMCDTVRFGLQRLLEDGLASKADSWLLIPADHPALTGASLSVLLEVHKRERDHEIIIPTFEGKRGHPAILPFSILQDIEQLGEGEGINQLLRRLADRTLLVPVADPAILWDLDTEEDYAKLLAHFGESDKAPS